MSRTSYRFWSSSLCILVCVGLVRCTAETEGYCEVDTDCPPGQHCNTAQGRCVTDTPDGGTDTAPGLDGRSPDGDLGPAPDQGKLKNGAPCTGAAQCDSGFCVDGFCCDGECTGACRSCAIAGSEGACTLSPAGQDPDTDCNGTDPGCDGTCDGFGQCSYPDSTTSCASPSCSAGELTLSSCDGSGGCTATKQSCGGYACNSAGDACKTSCTTTADCTGAFECVNQACTNPQPDGSPCGTNDLACQSGHCVDGVCCNSSCTNPCQSCAIAGKLGTCSPVTDNTSCGTPTCTGSTRTEQLCKSGTCTPVPTSCAPYLCNPAQPTCLAACSGDAQCISTAYCDGSKTCQPKKPNGDGCGAGNQCQSGFCAGGVCCDKACSPPAACVDGASSSTTTLKSCATGTCQTTTKACGTYRCDAALTDCRTGCTSDTHCVTDYFCISGQCVKKPNGDSCAAGVECLSGICQATEKVCCDKACAGGACESCTLTGKEGTCSFRAAGTPCDGGTVSCVDLINSSPVGLDTSYLTKDQCTGSSAACTAVKTTVCDPYKCAGANACRTSCTAHSHCSSTVCDMSSLFGTQGQCILEASICYADPVMLYPGAGTGDDPYPEIQLCLDSTSKLHIAAAQGTYIKNLQIKRQAAVWATETEGTLVDGVVINPNMLKSILQAASGTVVSVTSTAKPKVLLWGFQITRAQAGTGLPPLVDVVGEGAVLLHTCELTKNGGTCARVTSLTSAPTLTLEDVGLSACELGVDASGAHLIMLNCGLAWLPKGTGIAHVGDPSVNSNLILQDVHLGFSGGTAPLVRGIHAVNSYINFDRVRIGSSFVGIGIELENHCQGVITNLQISDTGVGLSTNFNMDPVIVSNATLANNVGPQAKCGGTTTYYNSILWKKNATVDSWSGSCTFHYSQVQKAAASSVPGTNNASSDPLFATVEPLNPFYQLTSSSPCRDQGTNVVPGISFPALDLAGAPRVVGGKVDRGALEVQ